MKISAAADGGPLSYVTFFVASVWGGQLDLQRPHKHGLTRLGQKKPKSGVPELFLFCLES